MSAAPLVAASERTGSDLEYLRKIVAGEYAQVPIGQTLGFRIAAADPGRVTLRGTPDARSYNLVNTVHGGWAAAILDTAIALSALTQMIQLGRRIAYCEASLADAAGKLLAHGTGSCLVLPKS
jgi:acyl-coenzyme A thioesterase PaaI-like protein